MLASTSSHGSLLRLFCLFKYCRRRAPVVGPTEIYHGKKRDSDTKQHRRTHVHQIMNTASIPIFSVLWQTQKGNLYGSHLNAQACSQIFIILSVRLPRCYNGLLPQVF